MSGEGSKRSSRADSLEAEPPLPPPPPPPPPGESALVPTSPRYRPPLPAPLERIVGSSEPLVELVPRRKGAGEPLPPLPPSLLPGDQEVSAAGDSCDGPRRLPEVKVPEAAAGKGSPGEPEAGACGEDERRGTGDQPETRSVCSSRSSSSGGGGDQRSGHQHQHHQPICKICFQGAEQVRPEGPQVCRRCALDPVRKGRAFSTADSARLTTEPSSPVLFLRRQLKCPGGQYRSKLTYPFSPYLILKSGTPSYYNGNIIKHFL